MRGITSGLEPRRYADGDLVQKALDLGVTPFGMSDEEIMQAISQKQQVDDISGASADFEEAGGEGYKMFGKDGLIFDYTNPVDYAMAIPVAGWAGAGIKALSTANKLRKLKKGADTLSKLNNPATRGIATGAFAADLGYDLATDPEMKDIFSNDAVDDAQEDLETVTNDQKEKEEKEKKDANLTDEEKEKKKSFLEKMGQVFEAYGASQGVGSAPAGIEGGMIKGTAINTPEITRYQGGGIADMMPQEPMMMAGGGIAHFALGGAAIKKAIKVGIEKGIGVFNKAKKSASKETKKIKEERKVKPQSTKKSKSTDLALYDEAAAKAAAPTRTRGYLDFLPAPIAGAGVAAGKGVGQAGRALYDLKKPLAIPGALAATGLGIATYANSGDPEPTAEEIAKAKKDAAKAEADAAYKARQAAREGLTALPEIRAARALERAQESGRTEANFVDYIATFPASYTEKIGKDPEFAKQMMAGFIAMAKPTEGFVPRNAFVDFGEAAMKERERQEGEVPDQIKLLEAIKENPDLLKSMRKLNEKTSDPITDAKNLSGLKDLLLADLYGENNYDEDDVILDARTSAELSDLQLLQMYKDSGGDLNVVRSNIMPKAKV
jgi:hypothetical protein